jgi:serine/threonine protein kinase
VPEDPVQKIAAATDARPPDGAPEREPGRTGGPPAASGAALATSAIPSFGTVLAGKYRLESLLGAGGMGVVVSATHLQLQELVAVKLLHPEMASRPSAVKRFLREARVAMKLRGEHVVRVLDVGMAQSTAYLVMERLDGSDLGSVVRESGRLEVAPAADYVLQACEAIAEAHAAGVVHRDLKPANLFLTHRVDGSPCIKVLDFGVSKLIDSLPVNDLEATAPGSTRELKDDPVELGVASTIGVERGNVTQTRTMLGSPRYMAPEQLRSARDVDARADLWALGVILFELLSGKPPFTEESLDALTLAINQRAAPPLRGVPAALDAVVQRCLAKDREGRWPDAPSLAAALVPFASAEGRASAERIGRMMRHFGQTGRGGRAPALTAPAAIPSNPSRPRALGAALLVLLALVVAWLASRGASSPPEARAIAVPEPPRSAAPETPSEARAVGAAVEAAPPLPAHLETRGAALPPRGALDSRPARAKPSPGATAGGAAPRPAGDVATAPPEDPLKFDAGFLFDRRK